MRRMFSKKQIEEISLEKIEATENLKVFENIVDKDGHKRFLEGEIDYINETEGLTFNYLKWSLSGTHLMFVMAGNISNGTTFASAVKCRANNLPQWILDKIVPVYATYSIEQKSISYTGDDYSSQSGACIMQKNISGENYIIAFYFGGITASKDRGFRIQFDLLIDNE